MPITQITAPSALPLTTGDYQAQNNLTDARLSSEAMPLGSGVILKGSKFIIKGATFIATTDNKLVGTPSNYVTLTVTGTDAVPTYVADLTGVVWSDIYNGYYDASENYVWFDEMKAYILGVISTPKVIYNKIISDITNQVLKTTSDVEFNSVVTPTVSASSVSATTVTATGAISGASIDTGNGAVELDQDLLETSNVTFNNITANGEINPTTTPIQGSFSTTSTPQLVPRGVYKGAFKAVLISMASAITPGGWNNISLEGDPESTIISSGSDMRISSTTPLTIPYSKT